MNKKIVFMIFFTLITVCEIYSQTVMTADFYYVGDNVNQESWNLWKNEMTRRYPRSQGYIPVDRLPNAIIDEVNKQLLDYQPLYSGQLFIISILRVLNNLGSNNQGYWIHLRMTSPRNWEFVAYMRSM